MRPPETDRVPPALIAHLHYVFTYFDPVEPGPPFLPDYEAVVRRGRSWWSAAPELEQLGHSLLAPSQHPEMRRRGCMWLTLFPSLEMVGALRAVALSAEEPRPLRDQAVWTLGFRQLQDRHDSLFWAPEVVAAADAALLEVARRPESRAELRQLCSALRHVRSPEILAMFAEDPVGWAPALEAFADAPLARAALARLDEMPAEDGHRVVRLVADVLGEEAAGPLLDRVERIPWAERTETVLAALAVSGARASPHVDALRESMSNTSGFDARVRWHEAHPGVLPTVRALRTARVTAALPRAERRQACRQASDLLASQARIFLFAEEYLYAMWRHVAVRADDPQRVEALVDAHPPSLTEAGVAPLYLAALAAAGRFRKLLSEAQRLDQGDVACWLLATHGRPFLALGLRSVGRTAAATSVAAQALALFLAGRPDLARRTLSDDLPAAAVIPGSDGRASFPGPDEHWRAEHGGPDDEPLRALMGGIEALIARCHGAPASADPDSYDPEVLQRLERSLRRELAGATVFLAGDHRERASLERALTERGARVAAGPFAGIDFYILGDSVPVTLVAKLERQGARRLEDPRPARVTP